MTPEEQAHAAAILVSEVAAPDPVRRLSWVRILGVIAVVGAVTAGMAGLRSTSHSVAASVPSSAFMPYVDVTATPTFGFEDPSQSSAKNLILGFVVSSKTQACEPSWGGAYSLSGAATQMDLDRRIARLRQRGGHVAISFGGAANTELSTNCTDPAQLLEAYSSVVTRYSIDAIDLDIEGAAASSAGISTRRAQAIRALQQAQKQAGHPVQVWLTLPVSSTGLTDTGKGVLNATLAAQVELAGVNGMTMNYGQSLPAGLNMADTGEAALTSLASQLATAYTAAGNHMTTDDAWQHVGATPMIGQNEFANERFGLDEASRLVAFAQRHHLRRLSMWSVNRDQSCGPNYANVEIVSANCSGVEQKAAAFTAIFGQITADNASSPTTSTSTRSSPTSSSPAGAVDDPATSPYQIWSPVLPYAKGTKVVWHHNVYETKWWTQGDTPDDPVASASDTPWTLVGPVLPGEHPAPTPTLKAGSYPQWSAGQTYIAGQRVLYQGIGYVAKWYTHGDVPGLVVSDPGQTPWGHITS
jgi:chitinase